MSAEAAASVMETGDLSDTYIHEWMHYLQFSATPIGILLSQYRRNCFLHLRNSYAGVKTETPEGYIDEFARFKLNWESWPSTWYQAEKTKDRRVAEVVLRVDGLHARLVDSELWFRLPIGAQAVFEAWAWCATALHSTLDGERIEIPLNAGALLYTWPIWVMASITNRDVETFERTDVVGVTPILCLATFFDYRILSCSLDAVIPLFSAIVDDLRKRNVTIGRFVYQLFQDYKRIWRTPPSIEKFDLYITQLGLPSIFDLMDCVAKIIQEVAAQLAIDVETSSDFAARTGRTALHSEALAEADILNVTAANFDVIRNDLNIAILFPTLLGSKLAPPVCAIENPNGYLWATVGFGSISDRWSKQSDSRVILRQHLSINEHILLQYAFGSHLACYGSADWRQPINPCPDAIKCLGLKSRRGIEFCTDLAWRVRVAELLGAISNAVNSEPSDSVTPGIEKAASEYDAVIKGELALPGGVTPIDLEVLGVDGLLRRAERERD
jgi:hypothetical protein